jgi:restriction endonuclease S subunit
MAVWQTIKLSELSHGLRLDPEYYKPELTELDSKLITFSRKLSHFSSNITTGKTPQYYDGVDTIPVIRSGDLDNFFIDETISTLVRTYPKNKGINLNYGDILISAIGRGSIGKVSIYLGGGSATTVSEVIVLQKLSINPYLLAAFLSSKYGKIQIDRQITGSTGQLHLIRQYLEEILVPTNLHLGKKIEDLYLSANKIYKIATNLYPEAENELLERIGWKHLTLGHTLGYKILYSDAVNAKRLDSEYFQPKFLNLKNHLKNMHSSKLGDFCAMPNRGVQPIYSNVGNVYIINSKHIGATEIDIRSAERTTNVFYNQTGNEKARLQPNDVLMYSTGAYIGRTNVYLDNFKGLASNHVTIIRPDKKICNPIYLALYLNSPLGLMQTDQQASGSAQREIYPQNIIQYEIFLPLNGEGKIDMGWQNNLSQKITKAQDLKREAEHKLEEAKELVENAINKVIDF